MRELAQPIQALLDELDTERDRFSGAVAEVDPALMTAPGVVGDWSARDLVHHVAYWSEHATDALELAMRGAGGEFAYDRSQTDAMNALAVREARGMSVAAAREREYRAFAALRAALAELSPDLLRLRLGNGDTVQQVTRYDGPALIAELAPQLRGCFGV
jgi:hypothetical protein